MGSQTPWIQDSKPLSEDTQPESLKMPRYPNFRPYILMNRDELSTMRANLDIRNHSASLSFCREEGFSSVLSQKSLNNENVSNDALIKGCVANNLQTIPDQLPLGLKLTSIVSFSDTISAEHKEIMEPQVTEMKDCTAFYRESDTTQRLSENGVLENNSRSDKVTMSGLCQSVAEYIRERKNRCNSASSELSALSSSSYVGERPATPPRDFPEVRLLDDHQIVVPYASPTISDEIASIPDEESICDVSSTSSSLISSFEATLVLSRSQIIAYNQLYSEVPIKSRRKRLEIANDCQICLKPIVDKVIEFYSEEILHTYIIAHHLQCHQLVGLKCAKCHQNSIPEVNVCCLCQTCEACNKKFGPQYIDRHLKRVHIKESKGEKELEESEHFECLITEKCTYRCSNQGQFVKHLADKHHTVTHKDPLIVKCPLCSFKKASVTKLRVHIKKYHLGGYPGKKSAGKDRRYKSVTRCLFRFKDPLSTS